MTRLAITAWSILLLVVTLLALFRPHAHSVYPLYAEAGRHWQAGVDLYRGLAEAYRYSPLASALFVPFGLLPEGIGGAVWKLLNAAIYLGALAWWVRSALPENVTVAGRAALFLLVIPLSAGSLHNGQCNPAVAGLLLGTLAASATHRWRLAAVTLALACSFKLYVIALGLLLVVACPRPLGGWSAAALAGAFLLPFLLQHPDYVARQYADWTATLAAEDRSGWPLTECYRDLWLLCRAWSVPLSRPVYGVIQVASGAAAALACLAGRRAGWSRRQLLTAVLALGSCWVVLCGPATESATYLLLAPTLAWAVLETRSHAFRFSYPSPERQRRGKVDRRPVAGAPGWDLRRTLVRTSYGLFLIAACAAWFPDAARLHAFGLQPLAALLLLAGILAGWRRAAAVTAPLAAPSWI